MTEAVAPLPDPTAVMSALNRAAHLVLDPAPHVFIDKVGLRLANVPAVLRRAGFVVSDDHSNVRPDGWLFSPRALEWFRGWRGTFVARARFVEDLVLDRPSLVVSTGVTQYITRDALAETMRDVESLASGTSFVCTFMLPVGSILAAERELRAVTEQRAAERDDPWISFYEPVEVLDMARAARFDAVEHVSPASWDDAWFRGRSDDLHPSSGEHVIVASV